MKDLNKNNKKPGKSKQQVHFRKKYTDHSQRFLGWVDSLGFEQTVFGRVAQKLDQRFHLRRVIILFFFCLLLSVFMFAEFDFTHKLQIGDVAQVDIKSPVSFELIDEVATEVKRVEAEESTPALFDYDAEAFEPVFNNVYSSFRKMRNHVRESDWPTKPSKHEAMVKDFFKHKKEFESLLNSEVSNRDFEWLVNKKFSASTENVLIRVLSSWSKYKVAEIPKHSNIVDQQHVVIRALESGGDGVELRINVSEIKDLSNRKAFVLPQVRGGARYTQQDKKHLLHVTQGLTVSNLTFNKQETASRKTLARNSVLPVQISIKKNQNFVRAGTQIQPIHITILNEIKNLKSENRTDFIAFVSAVFLALLVLVFISYLRRFTRKRIVIQNKDFMVMAVVSFLVIGITKLYLFIMDAAFVSSYGDVIPHSAFLYSAPVAAGAMLIGLLITYGEVVWLFTAFLSMALAIMVDMNFSFLTMSLVGGIAAARGVYACEKRNDIYYAGLRTGLVNAVIVLVMVTMQDLGSGNLLGTLMWSVPAGFVGGILSSLAAMTFVPLLESVFNYTTDVKLLELSNLSHPLMKEMVVKAPGTYHHSLSVGSMVEKAARDIGANPLLAKVMAYYHDIGKMEHAQYFVENQRVGHNPHDQITPFMSKTILIAHVKDGAELGMKHKLGKPIIDGILQHHGTTLISYFYNKAVAECNEEIAVIEESDFRYPGPKPQFREAALVMLADSIEAAARSMDEPTATRLTHLVENIIQSKFIDGQLNECNLTLKNLGIIEATFKKTLLSIYHQRIDYPHMNLGAPVKPIKKKKNLHSVSNN